MTTAVSATNITVNFTLTITPTSAELFFTANVVVSTVTGSASWTSSDGIHYFNSVTEEYSLWNVDLLLVSGTLGTLTDFTGEINKLFAMDVYKGYQFEGVYEYINDTWQPIKTQLDASEEHILNGKTAYTNQGVTTGILTNYITQAEYDELNDLAEDILGGVE